MTTQTPKAPEALARTAGTGSGPATARGADLATQASAVPTVDSGPGHRHRHPVPVLRRCLLRVPQLRGGQPRPHFVWFENFASVLGDQIFWESVKVTGIFAVVATTIETVLGVGLALLLNRSSIIGKIFEKVLILPLMIAPVIAGVIWKLMFNPQFGILNHVLGLGNTFDWLSAGNALWSVILVDLWIFTPFVAILVLAGIRSLPKEPFEASEVDGANWFYMFRKLMLPMLWPYILVAVIFRFMDNLKVFDHIYVLTAGGPGVATRTLQIGAFEDSIINLDYSRGSTYMLLLWIIVFITARYLVSVLGKAQRRAAGAES